ncbi:MAG: putative bifunctional diguanylate cyclase/phosphodiesterase [Lysobacter sp.]
MPPRTRAARLRRHTVALARAARSVIETDFDGGVKALAVVAPFATEALGLRQVSLWQLESDDTLVCRTLVRYPSNGDAPSNLPPYDDVFAPAQRKAPTERVLRVPDVAAVGEAPWFDFLTQHGSAAHLDARIFVGGAYWGQLCFHSDFPRRWHADEAALAGYFADVLGVAVEREERRLTHAQLEYLQMYDPVSGLANRSLFHACLSQALRQARTRKLTSVLLFVDVDRFHTVNESIGELAGNELLAVLADRINSVTPNQALLGRVESDCFGVLLPHIDQDWMAMVYAESILKAIAAPLANDTIELSASLGVAFASTSFAMTAEEWLRNADMASKEAKASGRNCAQVFDTDQHRSLVDRLVMERGLRLAIAQQRIEVAYQGEFDLETQTIVGAEALARWRQTDGSLTTAGDFIDVAESSGLIEAIGDIVLRSACEAASRWPPCPDGRPRFVRVNMSARQFEQMRLLENVRDALDASGLEPSRLCIEITETTLMARAEMSLPILAELRALGVRVAIDDFGSGYSSLSYLRRFPVDTLKVDKALIDPLPGDPTAMAILTAIIGLASALELEVVVEGIERADQEDVLRSLGLRHMQGFYYARPETAARFAARLAE